MLNYVLSYVTAALGLLSIAALAWWAGRPNKMREQESSDRDYFDQHGHWPEEAPQSKR